MVDRGLFFFFFFETLIKLKVETRTYILGFVMQYNSYLLKNLEQGFSCWSGFSYRDENPQ